MSTGSAEAASLIEYLGSEPDERIVVSAVTVADEDSDRLLRASVLIVPGAAADANWCGWQESHGVFPIAGSEPDRPIYVTTAGRFQTFRAVTEVEAAISWLNALMHEGQTEDVGILPAVTGNIASPAAPILLSRHQNTTASQFIGASVRSAHGFYFPSDPFDVECPLWWNDDLERYCDSPRAAGLAWIPGDKGGVVLARLERRAWFNNLRVDENLETFD